MKTRSNFSVWHRSRLTTGTEKTATSPSEIQMFSDCVKQMSVWLCCPPICLRAAFPFFESARLGLLSHSMMSWLTVSPGQRSEKSAEIADSSSTSHSNFEGNKAFRTPCRIDTCSNHDTALESASRVCMGIALFAISWARKDEALAVTRIVLFVSYVEYHLQGAMFMFKSHEVYQFYFDGFLEKEL